MHLLDLTEADLIKNYLKVRKELQKYDKSLSNKREIIVFNKSDLLEKEDIEEKLKLFKKKFRKKIEIISVFKDKKLVNIKKLLLENVHR